MLEKKKRNTVFRSSYGSDRVQGAPPPCRDLVVERVSKVTKETDLNDHIKSKGVCSLIASYVTH